MVKTGQKKEEKRFLGYEFSNRRGSEGIHPIQRGKLIDDCTKLYDATIFDNPEKASTYIYKAFTENKFDLKIPETLQKNVSYQNLIDMVSFDRLDFEKSISLSVKKKVKIETKWNIVSLKEFVDLQNGFAFKSADYLEKSNTLNFRQANIRLKGVLDLDYKETFLPDSFVEKHKNFVLKNGDIVIAMTDMNSDLNLLAIPTIFNNSKNTTFLLNQRVGKFIDFKTNIILPSYLNNILKSKISREQLKSLGFGSVQFNLSKQDLLNFKIPLPPKETQKIIVSEIELLEKEESKTVEKIKKLKSGIYDLISSNSKAGKISDICEISKEKCNPQLHLNKEFIYLGLEHIESNSGKLVSKNKETGNNIQSTKNVFKKGNVLYGKLRPYLNKVLLTDFEGICSTDILVLQSETPFLLKHILLSEKVVEQTSALMSGVSLPRIKINDFLNVKIPIVEEKKQKDIISKIKSSEKKITELESKISTIPQRKEEILKKHLE